MRTAIVAVLLLAGCKGSESNPVTVVESGPKSQRGETCSKTADCVDGLRCIKATCRDLEAERLEAEEQIQAALRRQEVEAAERCKQSTECREDGHCAAVGEACVATADGCRRSSACKYSARCALENGACVSTDASCRASDDCRTYGRCSARSDGTGCEARSDADCKASGMCRRLGECAARRGRCVRTDPMGCPETDDCKQRGLCTYSPFFERCVALPKDCRASARCTTHGECSENPATQGCRAAYDADCRNSEMCRKSGDCAVRDGRCGK